MVESTTCTSAATTKASFASYSLPVTLVTDNGSFTRQEFEDDGDEETVEGLPVWRLKGGIHAALTN